VTLDAGTYTVYCPGGDSAERGTLTVTGQSKAGQREVAAAAVDRYRRYVEDQTALLVKDTEPFVQAVEGGDLQQAERLYPDARLPYERVEPVAEWFGNLDPVIDARAGDVPAAKWSGFHPIEKALWVDGTAHGIGPVAAKLLDDVKFLQKKVKTIKLEPAQIANGADELLGEVSSSKITGEEERYSHTDLWDFEANVEGSKAAFDAVRPLLEQRDPDLTDRSTPSPSRSPTWRRSSCSSEGCSSAREPPRARTRSPELTPFLRLGAGKAGTVNRRLLGIYLNDHLAGSVMGSKLARRIVRQNEGNDYGARLAGIADQIEEDRATLRDLMDRLGIDEQRTRMAMAWLAEKAMRLKPNGKVVGYSPLSRVLELETLTMGITGKLELWRSMEAIGNGSKVPAFDFVELARRAEAQRDVVEDLRVRAAREALGPGSS
jgi:hypothetical protein